MSNDQGKPPGKVPDKDRFDSTGAGRVGKDDRGNMTWEWADDEELQADDTLGKAERLRALVDPALTVAEDDSPGNKTLRNNPQGLRKGYDPYDSGTLGSRPFKKQKNLRELSKWIETRKKVEESGGGGMPDDTEQK